MMTNLCTWYFKISTYLSLTSDLYLIGFASLNKESLSMLFEMSWAFLKSYNPLSIFFMKLFFETIKIFQAAAGNVNSSFFSCLLFYASLLEVLSRARICAECCRSGANKAKALDQLTAADQLSWIMAAESELRWAESSWISWPLDRRGLASSAISAI